MYVSAMNSHLSHSLSPSSSPCRLMPCEAPRKVNTTFRSIVSSYSLTLNRHFVGGPAQHTVYRSRCAVFLISHLASSFNVNLAQYADDTLYVSLNESNFVSTLSDGFRSIHHWLDLNGLSLNPDKTEAIVIGTRAHGSESKARSHRLQFAASSFMPPSTFAVSESPSTTVCLSATTSTTSASRPTSTHEHCDTFESSLRSTRSNR